MSPTTFELASALLARALLPLADAASDPNLAIRTLARLGWQPPPGVDISKALVLDVGMLADKLASVVQSTAEERQDSTLMGSRYRDLLAAIGDTLAQVEAAAAALPAKLMGPDDYATKTNIASELPQRLLDYVVSSSLARAPPFVPAALQLLGVMRTQYHGRDDSIYQTEHDRVVVDWPRIWQLLSPSGNVLAGEYAWGTAAFQADRLLAHIGLVLTSVGARATTLDARAMQNGGGVPIAGVPDARLLVERGPGVFGAPLGLEVRRLAASDTDSDAGIEIVPFASVGSAVMDLMEALTLKIDSDLHLDGGIALQVRPSGVRLVSESGPVSGRLAVGLHYGDASAAPRNLVNALGGLKTEFSESFVEIGGTSDQRQPTDAWVRIGLLGCNFSVTTATADGFLKQIIPSEGLTATFDVVIRWSTTKGLQLEGGIGLEATFPLGKHLGPLLVESASVELRTREDDLGFAAEVAMSISLVLGPFAATVERMGVQARLSFPDTPGNLGFAQLDIGFKPPNGVGLAIESEMVSGGGFLLFDPDAGQYAGVFELTIAETVSVKVVALISTKLPDGRPGFALLIIITAEGFTPIQLGMGFVLTGIGGLLALNRTVELDAVRGGLKNGVLDSVLFPKDPVKNAGRLISTLNHVFPQAPDRLLVGPMVTIVWGSPPIVTARLALLLELPDPLRLIVLASVSALLPDANDPVLQLRVDAVGALDFKRGELSLDAAIYDSRLWKFALTGDLALRLRWKEDPQFLLSVGGFHPRYAAPPGFPRLERVALTLTESDNPCLRFDCYFAITSNTIQFGAHVDITATESGFELSGAGGFDALIQWSPFLFAVDVYARLAVRFAGATVLSINLQLGLVGPDPWRAHGLAEIQFLLIKAQVSFEFQIGEDRAPELPEEVDAGDLLWRAITDATNWSAALPAAQSPGVTLRNLGAVGVLAHPLAVVSVFQRVLPLDTLVAKLGAKVPRGGPATYRVDVREDSATTAGLVIQPVTDRFPLGQFQPRTDDQRLTEPDFVERTAGYTISAHATYPRPLDSSLVFETLRFSVLDEPATKGERSAGLAGVIMPAKTAGAAMSGGLKVVAG